MEELASSFSEGRIRLVLIGKTGAGKSSACNTILGEEVFEVARGLCSGTESCDFRETNRHGLNIQVTDTPGVCDTHRPFDEVYHEIIKSVAAVSPGPHAVLMCLRCDQRFTEEEYTAYQQLKDLFGHNMVSFMIIVFNGLDRSGKQDFNKLGQKIPKLGKVLDDLGSKRDERIIALNNEAPMENRLEQGDEILKMVAKIVSDNNGDCFTDDIMKRFEQKLKEKEEKEKKTRREIVQEIVIKKDEKAAKPLKEALPESEVKKWLCTIL